MENKKLISILEAVGTIAFGILVAIFGFRTFDYYFGIVFLVASFAALVAIIVGLVKYRTLAFGLCLVFSATLVFGITIITRYLSLGYLLYVLVLLFIAFGGALMFFGIYTAAKTNLFYGIGQIVVGALSVTVGVLFLTVPAFNQAFWIIVGILIAIYGVFYLVSALTNKKVLEAK